MPKLKAHHDYHYTPTNGTPRKVTFLAWAGKGWCKIIDPKKEGSPYARVPRFRLSEIPSDKPKPVQKELF